MSRDDTKPHQRNHQSPERSFLNSALNRAPPQNFLCGGLRSKSVNNFETACLLCSLILEAEIPEDESLALAPSRSSHKFWMTHSSECLMSGLVTGSDVME